MCFSGDYKSSGRMIKLEAERLQRHREKNSSINNLFLKVIYLSLGLYSEKITIEGAIDLHPVDPDLISSTLCGSLEFCQEGFLS